MCRNKTQYVRSAAATERLNFLYLRGLHDVAIVSLGRAMRKAPLPCFISLHDARRGCLIRHTRHPHDVAA